mmetsp:Transcript_141075/g.245899  ORF Transcript_141075/g.245899 Transcript_141075/m.245899 type:complete len:86 (+) Transcript_141075:262-519(+)
MPCFGGSSSGRGSFGPSVSCPDVLTVLLDHRELPVTGAIMGWDMAKPPFAVEHPQRLDYSLGGGGVDSSPAPISNPDTRVGGPGG